MRVLAIVEKAYRGLTPTGGAETMLGDMLEYLVSLGWNVDVLVLNGPEAKVRVNGVTVTRTQDKETPQYMASRADLIITHLGGTPRARMLGNMFNVPVAQLIHNTNEYTVGFMGDGCDYAIYNADWVSKYHKLHSKDPIIKSWSGTGSNYIRNRRCFDWPSMVLHPPVLDEYKPMADPKGAITLINLVENKGSLVMYELAERNPDWNFMGVIGGYSPEAQIIKSLPNVLIHEHVQDVDQIYAKTSILIVPSRYESYGRVAAEAMSRGVPVIASNTPGLRECLGTSHLLRDRDALPRWEQAIEWVWANYSVAQNFCLERHVQLYDQTQSELSVFSDEMERLVNGWPNHTCRA